MPAFPFHGWMPDGYKAMPLPVAGRVLGRPLEGRRLRLPARSCCRCSRTRARTSRTLMLLIALASILYGSALAFTHAGRAARPRLLVGRAARLHHAGDLLAAGHRAPRARCCRWSTTGSWWRPLFFIVALLAARAGGSEDIRDMGGIAFRAPVLATLFLISRWPPRDAGLVELRRRVPDPARRLQRASSSSRSSPSSAWCWRAVYALRLFIRAMHNRVGAERRHRARSASPTALVIVPLVLRDPGARALSRSSAAGARSDGQHRSGSKPRLSGRQRRSR